MLEDLPDVPPAIALLASAVTPDDDFGSLRKKVVSMLPDLRSQSERFLEIQIGRESDRESGTRFEVHLHGAIDPLSGEGCVDPSCRIATAERISRSVGLIADRVWLMDRFSQRIVHCDDAESKEIDELIKDFIVVTHLLPLISAGVIRFRSPSLSACSDCIQHFERQVFEISSSVSEAFASEFSLKTDSSQRPYFALGNAVIPTLDFVYLKEGDKRLPSVEEFARYWVYQQVRSVFWEAREASFTHGSVLSNSRAALAGLLRADGRLIDLGSIRLLEDQRGFTVPWVDSLDAAQIVELREEAGQALPRFRERLAAAMVFDGSNEAGHSRGLEFVSELREQAEEVKIELAIAQRSSSRFWKTTYGLLGLGLAAYGAGTDQLAPAVGGLLPLIQLLLDHKSGDEKEALRLKSRPGYVLLKAQDILAHSEDH